MKNVLFISLLISIAITQQRSSYSWEDGTGTILGTFGYNACNGVVDEANVGATSGISPYNGSRMLTVSDNCLDENPEAYIAWVTNLSLGDQITSCFYGYDTTPYKPSLRIWGNWTDSNSDIYEYSGSASGNTEYTDDSGWSQICHTWTVTETEDIGLVIKARVYSEDDDLPQEFFIDLVAVTAPNGSTVNYPGSASGCTDASGCNYNPYATDDDGSCVYPEGSISIYDIQYTSNQGEYCYESPHDQECWTTAGTVTAKSPTYSNFYIQDPASCSNLGDLNGDGTWNVLDIVQLANCVLADNCADLANGCAGDFNCDGSWNVLDIVILANCILEGDCEGADYQSYLGIYVHGFSGTLPTIGDNITITATVNEYYSLTQLIDGASYALNSSGNTEAPINIATGDLVGCSAEGESVESMLVRISDVTVSTTSNEFGEWYVNDGSGPVMINDKIFDGIWEDLDPSIGQEFASIVGVVDYAYSEFSILPRTMIDIGLSQTQPVADAGDDQMVAPETVATLDGSGSYDPNGSIIAYEWTQISGIAVNLFDEEAVSTTFTAPETNSDLVFTLTVYDNDYNEATDEVTISVGTGTPIQDIQCPSDLTEGAYCYETSMAGDEVSTYGIVTHVVPQSQDGWDGNFFLQDPDAETCGGIYIRDFDIVPNVGDELTLTGTVNEYYSFTQIIDVTSSSLSSTGNSITPLEITTGELGIDCSLSGEELEGMLVKVSNVTVGVTDEFGNIQINDSSGPTLMDDHFFDGQWPNIPVGNTYTSIVGVVGYSYSEFKIYPRNSSDFDQ